MPPDFALDLDQLGATLAAGAVALTGVGSIACALSPPPLPPELASGDALADPRFVGDAIDHYHRLCRGAAVGYAISIEHSKALAAAFCEAGFRARHVDAETPSALRRRTVAELGADELDVLFNVGLFTEGLDLPALGGVIMLRPTLSASLYRQMCGRALRPAEGKSEAVILDHVGNAIRHGLREWDVAWSLADRQKRRRGREPAPVKRCPQCGAMMAAAARQCANCHVLFHSDGEAPPISAPGQLVPAERQAQLILELRGMRWPEQREWAGADYRRLRLVGQVRGYHHAWARHEHQRALDPTGG